MIIVCPHCKAKHQLDDGAQAGQARCKKCGGAIDIAPEAAQTRTVITPGAAQQADRETLVTPPPPASDAPDSAAEVSADQKTILTPAPGAKREAASDPLVGQTLGGYEILRKLGAGGMGSVYEARQISLDRSVAVKTLAPQLAAQKDFTSRFIREALSVAKLNHTNIIQIYDVGKSDETYYFAMEFVRGRTLQDMIAEEGKMPPARAVSFIMQAARGLAYAHRKHIIHRDIKPDNIMINEEGVAKVADLGLAKEMNAEEFAVTASGVAMGTPYYIAPEQAKDAKKVDQRADIYSLGCTLYHMVTGKIPFDGKSAYEIITKHLEQPLTMPHILDADVPEDLSRIVARMMAKDAEKRYQTMGEVIEDMEIYLGVNYRAGGFAPNDDQINALRRHADRFASITTTGVHHVVLLALCGVTAFFGLLAVRLGSRFALGVLLYALTAPTAYLLLNGWRGKTYVYRRLRSHIFSWKTGDWLTAFVAGCVTVAVIWLGGVVVHALVAGCLGLATAVGYYFFLKRPLLKRERKAVEDAKRFTRELRQRGIPEEELHLFVCRHGGDESTVLCEAMFGYEAMAVARSRLTEEEQERTRRLFNLRELVIRWFAQAEKARAKEALRQRKSEESAFVTAETAVLPDSAAAIAAEQQAIEAQIQEPPRRSPAALALAAPRFILGAKGRILAGAMLVLLATWAIKAPGFPAALRSYHFGFFAGAVLVSGFTRSRAMLICLALSALFTGPLHWFGVSDNLLGKQFTIPGMPESAGKDDTMTLGLLFGVLFFIIAFAAAYIFRDKRRAKVQDSGPATFT